MPVFELSDEQVKALERMNPGTVIKPVEAPKPQPAQISTVELARQYGERLAQAKGQGKGVMRQIREEFRAKGLNLDAVLVEGRLGGIGVGSVKKDLDEGAGYIRVRVP